MKKNKLLLVSASLLAVAVLGSCGGSSSDPYANLDFGVDIRGTTIDMWTPFGTDMHEQLKQFVEEWSAITGVTVNLEAKSGYDTLKNAVSESASTTTYPHLTFAYPDHMSSYVGSDILLRLDTYFEKGAETSYDYAPAGDKFAISDFYEDYMRENQTVEFKEDGTGYTLGVPFNKSTEVLTYNVTFFDWVKTKDPSIGVPSTWEEVDAMCDKILKVMEENNVYTHVVGPDGEVYESEEMMQKALGEVDAKFDFSSVIDPKKATDANKTFAFRPLARDSQANFFITTVRQYGGEYTTVDKSTLQGKILFDSAESKAGLKAMQDRYNANRIGIANTWGENKYSSNPFSALKCVMTIGSSAGADSNSPKGGAFKVSCAPVPYANDNKYVISQGTNLVLLDKGSNAQRIAAWELLKYLTKYANGDFSKKTGYFPSCEYAFRSEEYQDFFNETPVEMDAQINLAAAKVNRDIYMNNEAGWTKFVDAAFPGSSTVRSTVDTAMPLLFIGNGGNQYTPDQVISDLYSKLSDYR